MTVESAHFPHTHNDILQLTDDISAAFHRILYHPTIAVVFASVWMQYLVIPVGTIFGSRSSPSTCMVHGELRSHYAQHMPAASSQKMTDLALRVDIGQEPPWEVRQHFAQATADAQNTGLENPDGPDPDRRQSSFVDDSGNAHIRKYFKTVVNASVMAAYLVFGKPSDDPNRPPCINPLKWISIATHVMKLLGYIIDTRLMIVMWPVEKRQRLRQFLDDVLLNQGVGQRGSTPTEVARVLGMVRHGAFISPCGVFYTLRLQYLLSDAASHNGAKSRFWWRRHRIHLPSYILAELAKLRSSLSDDVMHHLWHRPIGLLIPRDPTIITQTDASLNGLGGWCQQLNHKWRLSIQDLWACGFPRGDRHNPQCAEPEIDPSMSHINIYEFIALIIELWIVVRQLFDDRWHVNGGHFLGQAPTGEVEHGRGSSLSLRAGPIVGIRYRTVLRSGNFENLPAAARAAIDDFCSTRVRADRGLVRQKNDRSMDNRATRFSNWLSGAKGIRDEHLSFIDVEIAQHLLAAYLVEIRDSFYLKTGQSYSPKTLNNHLNAAHCFFEQVARLSITIRDEKGALIPLFDEILSHSRKWYEPNEKREPYTAEIFQALHDWVDRLTKDDLTCCLDLVPAVFDWLCLGIFTGCRVGEHAQSVASRGKYSQCPLDAVAGRWQGYATAFVLEDFTFLDAHRRILPPQAAFDRDHLVVELHVRFRFDKSKINFTIRKFRRGTGFLCPVEAALLIVRRALILGITAKEPLGVHRHGDNGGYTYLMREDVVKTADGLRRRNPFPSCQHPSSSGSFQPCHSSRGPMQPELEF